METPLAGAANPYTKAGVGSIRTGRGGVWEYSPLFRPSVVTAQGNIVLTGRRTRDYVAAEALTHAAHQPTVTVWHHVYNFNPANDTCTMQLVPYRLHQETVPHAGGCIQYSDAHGVPYRAGPRDPEAPQKDPEDFCALEPPEVPLHSGKEMEGFALATGRAVCPALRMLYGGERTVSPKGRALLAAEEDLCLDAVLPLTGGAGGANVAAALARLDRPGAALPPDPTALPFAIDPYGNEFWAGADGRLCFFDHETGRFQAAGRSLDAVIN